MAHRVRAAPGRPGTREVASPGMTERVRTETAMCMANAAAPPRHSPVASTRVARPERRAQAHRAPAPSV